MCILWPLLDCQYEDAAPGRGPLAKQYSRPVVRASKGHESGAWLSDTIIYGLGTLCYLQLRRYGKYPFTTRTHSDFIWKTESKADSDGKSALRILVKMYVLLGRAMFWLPLAGLAPCKSVAANLKLYRIHLLPTSFRMLAKAF